MINPIIVSGLLGWLIAQIIKTILYAIKCDKVVYERIVGAGGMPSSHTSMVISSLITVGRWAGTNTVMFGVAFIFSCIVIYDAMGVRRAAGQHARALNIIQKTISEGKTDETDKKELKELLGHTPLEVVGGAIVGIIVGILVPVKG